MLLHLWNYMSLRPEWRIAGNRDTFYWPGVSWSHQRQVITSIIECGMELLTYSQTSSVVPSKMKFAPEFETVDKAALFGVIVGLRKGDNVNPWCHTASIHHNGLSISALSKLLKYHSPGEIAMVRDKLHHSLMFIPHWNIGTGPTNNIICINVDSSFIWFTEYIDLNHLMTSFITRYHASW